MNETSEQEAFAVMQMRVNPSSFAETYTERLVFWKTIEEKYQARKRKWLEANSRMIAAKLTAIRAKKELEEARKLRISNSDSAIPRESVEEHYSDAKDDEFSDVDPDMFKDPADRYYSNLDATIWETIRNDLMNIHRRAMDAPAERRRMLMRGVILSVVLFAWIVIGVLYLFQKVEPEHVDVTYNIGNSGSACRLNCTGTTIVQEIIQSVFPAGHVDDEI